MVPSARNVEITARPCSFAPSWAASSRVVMCSPFVPYLRLKGSSFWLTIRKGHDLIAVLTTGSLRSYCPVSDRPTDTVLGSDASGHGSGISDIAWDALRSVPVAGGERQRALCDQDHGPRCRHAADAAACLH